MTSNPDRFDKAESQPRFADIGDDHDFEGLGLMALFIAERLRRGHTTPQNASRDLIDATAYLRRTSRKEAEVQREN